MRVGYAEPPMRMFTWEMYQFTTGTRPVCRTLIRISVIQFRSITAFSPNRNGEYDRYCCSYWCTIHVRNVSVLGQRSNREETR